MSHPHYSNKNYGGKMSTKWVKRSDNLESFLAAIHTKRLQSSDFGGFKYTLTLDSLLKDLGQLNQLELDESSYIDAGAVIFQNHLDRIMDEIKQNINSINVIRVNTKDIK